MHAVVPRTSLDEIWLWLASAIVLAIWLLAHRQTQSRRATHIQGSILGVLVTGIVLQFLFPAVARVSREYYGGKDHFEWIRLLRSPSKESRNDALAAIVQMLETSQQFGPRYSMIHALGERGTVGAPVLPVLRTFAERDEEPGLRWVAKEAIMKIEASKRALAVSATLTGAGI